MFDWFLQLATWQQALFAGLFTWGITAVGAGLVFFAKSIRTTILNFFMGLLLESWLSQASGVC